MSRQIIVCDDELHIVRVISLKFTRAGFEVKGVADAESCWQLLSRNPCPALLIVDYLMPPGPNGPDLVRRIRNDSRLANLPVIMLTAKGFEIADQHELLVNLKITEIVAKPFSPRELLVTVCRILGHATVPKTTLYGSECDLPAISNE
jgi:two-component system alkaline phosphatase synthesis response regulator PhoP